MQEKENHFIKNIEIKNFKCFEDFNAEGFGRVNLIGGKNNVGKTAFMEAVCINVYSKNINNMATVLMSPKFAREFLEIGRKVLTQEEKKFFLEAVEQYSSKSNINTIDFYIKNEDGEKTYYFRINKKETNININKFSYEMERVGNIKFLTNLGFINLQLKEVYEAVQIKDEEEALYKYINEFDNNILNFKIIGGDKPQCKIQKGTYRDINEFGDGLKHYISIICSLYACENGYLFIDEIDNGIHYTQLDKLWKIILAISKQQNVQVFATTHSKECIESYARVAKKLEDEEIRFIELGRDNDKITSIVYEYDEIINQVEQHQDIRGW
jgi:AAA15 family ATPase/GTPase